MTKLLPDRFLIHVVIPTLFRNGFCTFIPSLLSGDRIILQEEVSHSVRYRPLRHGLDFCSGTVHSVALGPICLAG